MTTTTANDLGAVFTTTNLLRAWENVAMKDAAPGIDGVTVEAFSRNYSERLRRLRESILSGQYRPDPYIVFPKEKRNGGVRDLVNATVRDKIVARAAATELVRRYDRRLEPQSYAYRPGRGALKAVSAVERHCSKATHAVRADILEFFDEMDHGTLADSLRQFGESEAMVKFILLCMDAPRFDGVEKRRLHRGVPQGSPLAPVLSNLYLHPLDAALNEAHLCFARYADDLLVLTGDADQAAGALARIQESLVDLKLRLSVDKTRVYGVDEGFPFLGFLFSRNGKTPCQEARERIHESLREGPYTDETDSEYRVRLAAIRRGWKNYFGEDPEDAAVSPGKGTDTPPDRLPPEKEGVASDAANTEPISTGSSGWTLDSVFPAVETNAKAENSGPTAATAETSAAPPASVPEPGPPATDATGPAESGEAPASAGELAAVLALRDSGRYGHAITRCRNLLNRDELDMSASERSSALRLLAELYERQGLSGAAQRCRTAAGDTPDAETGDRAATATPYTAQMVERWLRWFGHGAGVVARQYVDALGRHGYRPASKQLTAEYLRDHWKGLHTLAVPVYGKDNMVVLGIIDLDVTRRVLDTLTDAELQTKRAELLDDAIGLVDVAHRAGVDGVIEDSGCKGYHVWFFLHNPVSAKLVRHFMTELCRVAGPPPDGTHRGFLPGADTCPPDGINARIKLPLGIHRLTGKRCGFINPDGSKCTPVEEQQMVRGRINARTLRTALQNWSRWREPAPAAQSVPDANTREGNTRGDAADAQALTAVVRGCTVLRALQRKARETHDLSHYERIVLRGILAPLGGAGHAELHRIMKQCGNYDRKLTDRMLASAPPNPLSCHRIAEILGDFADQVGCACRFKPRKGEYSHPLRHVDRGESGSREPGRRPAGAPGRSAGFAPAGKKPTKPSAPSERDRENPGQRRDGDEISALLQEYHDKRMELLELQRRIQDACDRSGEIGLPFGTLRSGGRDPELTHWTITL